MKKYFVACILLLFSQAQAVELIIGEANTKTGMVFIFEGAVKDMIMPNDLHLPESDPCSS